MAEIKPSPAALGDTYLTSDSGVWEKVRASSLCGRLENWILVELLPVTLQALELNLAEIKEMVFYWLKLSDIFLVLLSTFISL